MKKIISALLALSILFAASSMCFADNNTQMVGYCMASNTCCVEFAPSAQTSQVKEQPIIEDLEFNQDGKSMDSSSGASKWFLVLCPPAGIVYGIKAAAKALTDAVS